MMGSTAWRKVKLDRNLQVQVLEWLYEQGVLSKHYQIECEDDEDMEQLYPTFAISYYNGVMDVFSGNVVFVGTSKEEIVSLSDEQIQFIKNELFTEQVYMESINDNIPVILS